jgi:hypothetical protein
LSDWSNNATPRWPEAREIERLTAVVERVRALASQWDSQNAELAELAAVRSSHGEDGLTRSLAVDAIYAEALRAALEETL